MHKYVSLPEVKENLATLHKEYPDYLKTWEVVHVTPPDDEISASFRDDLTTIRIKARTTSKEWERFFTSLKKSAQVRSQHQRLRDEIATHLQDCRNEQRAILNLWDDALQPAIDWQDEKNLEVDLNRT